MTKAVIEHLDKSLEKLDRDIQDAFDVNREMKITRFNFFVKSAKRIAERNERLWEQYACPHKK